MKKGKIMKKISALLILLIMISCLGIINIEVKAANYSSKFTTIDIPNKYENFYSSTDEESEYESYSYYDGDFFYVTYNVYERYIGQTIYTQTSLEDHVADMNEIYAELNCNVTYYYKELIEINGCKGMRIAYKVYDNDYDSTYYYDDYYFLTDKYEVELIFESTKYSFIGSQEEQAIVKSFKIKDTVLKSRDIPFTDVASNAWYYSAVKYNYENNMIKGLNDYTFGPSKNLTRGMLVTILHRMEGSPSVSGASKFTDVQNTKDYYYTSVKWATQNNIISGYNSGKFGPNDPITREQLAVILSKHSKFKGKYKASTASLSSFKDASKVSSFAETGMQWAVGNGVITGNASSKTLNPQGTTTRAEAASMLYKYCSNVK